MFVKCWRNCLSLHVPVASDSSITGLIWWATASIHFTTYSVTNIMTTLIFAIHFIHCRIYLLFPVHSSAPRTSGYYSKSYNPTPRTQVKRVTFGVRVKGWEGHAGWADKVRRAERSLMMCHSPSFWGEQHSYARNEKKAWSLIYQSG